MGIGRVMTSSWALGEGIMAAWLAILKVVDLRIERIIATDQRRRSTVKINKERIRNRDSELGVRHYVSPRGYFVGSKLTYRIGNLQLGTWGS